MKTAFAIEATEKNDLYRRIVKEYDLNALDLFFLLNRRSMVQFAFKYTHNEQLSEDVVQDVFAKIYTLQRDRKNGEEDNAFCNTPEYFRTWAFRLASTRAIRVNTLEKREAHEVYDTVNDGPKEGESGFGQDFLPDIETPCTSHTDGFSTDPLDIVLRQANHQTVRQALDHIFNLAKGSEVISAALSSAIAKVELEEGKVDWKKGWTGMDYKEMAKTLGIEESTARTRCHNGRGKIARELKKQDLVPEFV